MNASTLSGVSAVVGLEQAGKMLGLSRTHTYALAQQGRFPVDVRRVGSRYKVPTAPLLRYLGVESSHDEDTPPSSSSSGPLNRPAIRCKLDGTPINPDRWYRYKGQRIQGADLLAGAW